MTVSQQWTSALAALGVLAACLWLSDVAWTENWVDAVPALAAIPLFCWLGRPWRLRDTPRTPPMALAAVGTMLLCVGAVSEFLMIAAMGWTCLLACALIAFVDSDRQGWTRLLPLAVLGFPWLAFQSPWLGWWFRYSGAIAAEGVLTALQMDIAREGTRLWAGGICISVGEACSGLQGLQAMLVAGTMVAIETLPKCRLYWWHLPILFAAAWGANALRVMLTALGAYLVPYQWIEGDAHWWQGWLLLCLMFVACQALFRALAQSMESTVEPHAETLVTSLRSAAGGSRELRTDGGPS